MEVKSLFQPWRKAGESRVDSEAGSLGNRAADKGAERARLTNAGSRIADVQAGEGGFKEPVHTVDGSPRSGGGQKKRSFKFQASAADGLAGEDAAARPDKKPDSYTLRQPPDATGTNATADATYAANG